MLLLGIEIKNLNISVNVVRKILYQLQSQAKDSQCKKNICWFCKAYFIICSLVMITGLYFDLQMVFSVQLFLMQHFVALLNRLFQVQCT